MKKNIIIKSNSQYENEKFAHRSSGNTKFQNIEFLHCTFQNNDFTKSEFSNCIFTECVFKSVTLTAVKLTNSLFTLGKFISCRINGVDWSSARTTIPLEMSFEKCDLSYSIFSNMNISGTSFSQCKIYEVEFVNTIAQNCSFKLSDLLRSRFSHSDLRNSDFREAQNFEIDPRINKVKKAKFSEGGVLGLLASFQIEIE